MTRARTPARQLFAPALIALALLIRFAVPAGWMPVAGASGFTILPCSGAGPVAGPAAAMPGHDTHHAMAGMVDHATAGMDNGGEPSPAAPAHEQPCPFAALAVAAPPPEPAVLPLPGATWLAPLEARRLAFIRAGIGQPPQPSTGPPLSA